MKIKDRIKELRQVKAKMKLSIILLATALLLMTFGCHPDAEPKRFQCIERFTHDSYLYRDTKTGDIWIHTKGGLSADTWTRLEAGDRPDDK